MSHSLRNDSALTRIQNWMTQENIQISLYVNPVDIQYLTGFSCNPHERFLALLVFQDGALQLIVPHLELEKASDYGVPVISHKDGESPYPYLVEALQQHALTEKQKIRIAIEKEILTVARFEGINEAIRSSIASAPEYIGIDEFSARVRAVKTPAEIECMQEAAELTDRILEEVQGYVRPGMTELDVVQFIEARARELGASSMSFDTMALCGAKSALPHGRPADDLLEAGQFLLLDFGVVYKGYCSDITRTFVLGKANDEQKKLYEAVKAANEAALGVIRPGIQALEVDQAARTVLENAGYGPYFTHRVGHGLGIELHEFPSIHGANDYLLEPGVTFTVEPGAYLPGFGGVRIEDDIAVTEKGVRILTQFTKNLIEIPFS